MLSAFLDVLRGILLIDVCELQKVQSSSDEEEDEGNEDLALAMGFSGFGSSR